MRYDVRTELRGVLDTVGDAVLIVDEKWRVLNVNAAGATLFGYRTHEIIGHSASALFVARGERRVMDSLRETLFESRRRTSVWEGRLLGCHRDGHRILMEVRVGWYRNDGLVRFVLVMRDIRARRRAERALRQAALRDPLTGLLNRVAFGEELARAIERARRGRRGFAVLMLDLDHFKEVNDSAGHPVGDLLLRQAGRRLREQVRQSDVLARLGGDEFAVLSDDLSSPGDSVGLAERLGAAMTRPFHVAGFEVRLGASIGIAVFPDDAGDGDLLLARADLALYAAKASGRDTWRLFDSRMQEAASERRLLESELRVALREGQLELLYQPLVNSRDLEVRGLEALLRWNHPTRGVLRPDAFIPFAEQNRLIEPITEWVLDNAVGELARPEMEAVARLPTAVNISTRVFEQDHLLEILERVCRGVPLGRPQLILEITEGALAGHEHAAEILRALRQSGIRIAIDDFGMGHSSLARLKDLPLDLLKIDRSFIANLPSTNADRAFTDAIVRLATSLGIETVAEGVESCAQLRSVADLGCSQAQGHLIAYPMVLANVPAWLRDWQGGRRQHVFANCWGPPPRELDMARAAHSC